VEKFRGFHHTARWWQRSQQVQREVEEEVDAQRPPSDEEIKKQIHQGPVTKFQELIDFGMVHPNVVRTITNEMNLETMTEVQTATINEALKSADM